MRPDFWQVVYVEIECLICCFRTRETKKEENNLHQAVERNNIQPHGCRSLLVVIYNLGHVHFSWSFPSPIMTYTHPSLLIGIYGGMFVPIQTHYECEFKVTLWKFQISSCFFCPNGRLYFIGFLCHWRPLECDRSYLEVNLRTLEMRPVARLLTLDSDGDRHRAPSDRPSSAFFCFFRSFLR